MRTSRPSPQINSGSMADIAFLLLIFFLITTTITGNEGINRKLPRECPPGQDCNIDINERNILRISVNNKDELFVNDEVITLDALKETVKLFIDNNGDGTCSYCNGFNLLTASENPRKAVVSLQNGNLTSYEFYIAVQDELTKAYYELRSNYIEKVLQKKEDNLTSEELKQVKDAYPFILSEAITK